MYNIISLNDFFLKFVKHFMNDGIEISRNVRPAGR